MTTGSSTVTETRPPLADRVSRLLGYAAGVAVLAMMFHVTADVVARTVRGAPLGGTLEWTTWVWMPAIVFLALAGALAAGEHLRVTMLVEALTRLPRKIAEALTLLLLLGVVVLLDVGMWMAALESFKLQEADLGAGVEVSIWPMKFVAAFGLAMLGIQALSMLVHTIIAPTKNEVES